MARPFGESASGREARSIDRALRAGKPKTALWSGVPSARGLDHARIRPGQRESTRLACAAQGRSFAGGVTARAAKNLFSAIYPASGTAVGHVADRANTWEMSRHLREIGGTTEPGRHALIILDGAGWHVSKHLEVPDNVSLLRLPPYSPELNSSENGFQFLKARYFANQVFAAAEAVKETVWKAFEANPDRITSIGSRSWAQINCGGAVES